MNLIIKQYNLKISNTIIVTILCLIVEFMKISIHQLKSIIVQFILLFILYYLQFAFSNFEKEIQMRYIAILAIFILIISELSIYYVKKKIDCFGILIILIFIFMFGQHFLFLIGTYPKNLTIISGALSKVTIYKMSFFVLKCVVILNIGYLIKCKKINIKRNNLQISNKEINRKIMFKTGVIFFCISIVPTLIILSKNIYLTFTVGYGERMLNEVYRSSGVQNITGILASFMIPTLLLLFITRKKENKIPIIIIIVYMILYTASGSRINTMILLIGILYLQTNMFSKLNIKKTLKYLSILIMVFLLFSVVSSARSSIGSNLNPKEVIKESFNDTIENSIIVSALSEAGYTFCATATVFENCPSNEPFNYGLSYISGIAYILPNGMTGNFYARIRSTDEVFKGYLNQYGSGIGSSFIGEAYWNFGQSALFLMLIFGIILAKVSNELDYAISSKNYESIFKYTYIFVTIAFYVRSDTRTFLRNYIWFCLPIIFVAYFFKYKYNERSMK
ncbi:MULTISPECIES: O-antigen polysaccharide polymerase Wzy [Bacillota]|uniref:O-antigen polysaccharide polymerase Wzy n=3 Tax=Amedibacillus TaxID=2749846 RepID=A0A7G9GKP6_9FIRM|nr:MULTISPECIES: O-antigen polysaccharide polymerase Wzy [Bacillota]QNM11378.1 O-antigen polysaccharide polymerase Wzy [[Eubacterium] hominis]MCH4284613.1 O-antigen polysaccharide polymerase Wzy family protein [Amedibacillus hominis]RGB54776.1 O-antigen polysaccharide polymerase Wzy [Absiella sp. AM22-9]RGB60352.1 O-antigen polysaccharide polymerase Wzy [Absiella sp. AM10-20]RGB65209.1 O-antigen polysaccharide polymerase Wzy [Absiella sp. AM09-45]